MKTAYTLAVLGALAATPAFAQGMGQPDASTGAPSYQSGQAEQHGTTRHQAANTKKVRNVQQALIDQGYQVGPVDGRMGPKTREALRDFQQKQGIQANGRLDEQTLAALGVQGGPQQAQTPEQRPMGHPTPPSGGTESPPSGGMESPPAGGTNAPGGGGMGR